MDDLRQLMFELSNEHRLGILQMLEREGMNATSISKSLNLTIQESSRHLSRLGRTGLTWKDEEGLHHVSMFGRLFLNQLDSLNFTSRYRNYFATHSLDDLPVEFVGRLGELSGSRFNENVMLGFKNIGDMIGRAEEFIWAITDEDFLHFPLIPSAAEKGVCQ